MWDGAQPTDVWELMPADADESPQSDKGMDVVSVEVSMADRLR